MIKFVEVKNYFPSGEKYFQLFVDGRPSMIYPESYLKNAFDVLNSLNLV